ncbi:MAG: YhcH/YjgK/YiaL family protein [Clostridia bacterium]
MILGNIKHLDEFNWLDQRVRNCFDYAKSHDLALMAAGSYPIDGDNLILNINEYETSPVEERTWEAHRRYLDLQLMVCGHERIDCGFIANMASSSYVEQCDILPLEGEPTGQLCLAPGDFVVCYPNDAHRAGIQVQGAEPVKKAVFKIKIQ